MAVLLKVGSATVPVQVPSHIPLGLLRLWLAAEQDVPLEAVSLWYNGRRLGDKLPLGIHLPPNACIEAMVSLPGGDCCNVTIICAPYRASARLNTNVQ